MKGKNTKEQVEKTNQKTRRIKRAPRRIGILTKLIIILALLIVLSYVLFSGYAFLSEKIAESRYQAKSAMVSKELVQCAELSTVKMIYSNIATNKKNFLGISKSYSLVRFSGVARAGIQDISKIKTSISRDLNSIYIEMPCCVLLSNEITGFELFDESNNIFVSIPTQEILSKIEEERDKTGEILINEGLINEANNHAKSLLNQVFTAMGFTYVDVKIVDNTENL